ncbi:MAG TPA: DUF4932 domain-containing protein, partial [Candidatus Wallbacteria bacterium]|nr:DUF4932 domain-containing protein [Candidatus Wallbacteria bacterium]
EIKKSAGRLNISIDPRIELLSVVRLLSGYSEKGHAAYDTVYKKAALDHFKKFKKHPAVELYKKMTNSGFSYDAPPSTMLHLSWPDLKVKTPFTDYLITRARGIENLNKMAELFADFAKKSNFEAFYKSNADFYGSLIDGAIKAIGKNDFAAQLESYFGPGPNSYNIILAPILRRQGGYGPSVKSPDGKLDVYNIMGPVGADEKNYDFGGTENYRSLVWHEFGHSFVNPLTEMNSAEINLYKKLFDPIAKQMAEQAYPEWQTSVNEHIIRAVCARLSAINLGESEYSGDINYNKSRGFAYIEDLCSVLTLYEQQRSKYAEFKSFYPQVTALFKKLAESNLTEEYYKLKFTGTINAALSLEPASYILVVPDGEKDAKINAQIVKGAEAVKKMFMKSAKILKGSEALKLDASKHSFVAYGTKEGNSFIKKHMEAIPVKLDSNEIELKEKIAGANLRFITCWPNPADSARAIIIYTAVKAEDIVGINSVFHGPTDYVAADGEKILKSGNYKKAGGKWTLK